MGPARRRLQLFDYLVTARYGLGNTFCSRISAYPETTLHRIMMSPGNKVKYGPHRVPRRSQGDEKALRRTDAQTSRDRARGKSYSGTCGETWVGATSCIDRLHFRAGGVSC